MTREEALTVLGLDAGVTADEVRLAYRELAQMLHPDKFGANKKLRARAETQMARINEARDVLLKSAHTTSSRAGSGSTRARAPRGRASSKAAGSRAPRTPSQIAFEAEARARAAEAARLMVSSQARTLRERRGGMVTMSVIAALVMLFTARMGGLIGTLAFSVSSMLTVWGIVDIFTLSNQAKVLQERACELMRQRDAAQRIADEASQL